MDAARLHLGCGYKKLSGWINVDKATACNPDQVWDLEKIPWPWPDNFAREVRLHHVLEHLGASTDTYLGIIAELYRVCRPGARIDIIVPHPRHDDFLTDPTHVRPITAAGLEMFSQAANRRWIKQGAANTALGIYLGVDFAVVHVEQHLAEPWRSMIEKGKITREDLLIAAERHNNVVQSIYVALEVIKRPPA